MRKRSRKYRLLWLHRIPEPLLPLALGLALIFSGCTTQPVVIQPPPRTRPALCLLPAPTGLQLLPENLLDFDLQTQAAMLLTAHAADGLLYNTLRERYITCQQFIEGLP